MRCVLFALVLLVAGCAGPLPAEFAPSSPAGHGHVPSATTARAATSSATSAVAVGDYNLADVMYLQMAIANHSAGIDLVALAADREVSPAVGELAAAIGATQRSELERMRAWLAQWGHPAEASLDPAAHAHHGGMPITDPATIAKLAASPDGEFEQKFVRVLTGHQHNAVEMARQELRDGVSPEVKEFADKVVKSRTGQISALLKFA